MASHLDAHARPPEDLRRQYKHYQKASTQALDADPDLFDTHRRNLSAYQARNFFQQAPDDITRLYSYFLGEPVITLPPSIESATIYEHPDAPGLLIIPSLLDKDIQLALLDKLLHRDLSNPSHKTNLHMHYDMTYPQSPDGSITSFFSNEARNISHQPKDPSIHKPLPMSSYLNRKLRWVTIGGQYDWTQKVYPATAPPPFPKDVAALVEGLFPAMKAQAAIVNLYTPSDTLSLHRDVSEECDRPLVSISLGCDAIFMAGLEGSKGVAMRLRSGDALVMSGPARYLHKHVSTMTSTVDPSLPPLKPVYEPKDSSAPRNESPHLAKLISTLQLQQHIEGGYFVETDRDANRVPNPFLNTSPSASDSEQTTFYTSTGAVSANLSNKLTDADKNASKTTESENEQDKTRNASTSIHYLLTPESPMGAFHRNRGRTIHTLHRGRGRYVIIHADEAMPEYDSHSGIRSKARVETFIVGQNVEEGEKLQWIVDGGKYKS
ncbi:oxidoreductase, partial [Aureobasidium melanogenum]